MLHQLFGLLRGGSKAVRSRLMYVALVLVVTASMVTPAYALQTFDFLSGTAQITATAGATLIVDETVALTGAFVEFDELLPEVTDFEITLGPSGTISMVNPYGGYDMFVIEAASVVPGVGYMNQFIAPTGPNSWNFLIGPVDVNGTYSASDSGNVTPPVSGISAPFAGSSFLNGNIDSNLVTFELLGVTLMELPAGFFPGETEDLVVKADITWSGTLSAPEPSTGVLLVLGVIGLAARPGRSRG